MQSVVCRFLYITLFLLSFSCLASDYANYDVYTDESGNIYLKAPDKLVVLPQRKAIPIQIASPNGLLRLYEVKGVWYVEVLTQAEWDALNLTPGNDIVEEIRYDDFDGSGTAKLFLALRHRTTSQLLISDLTGTPAIEAFYFEPVELAGNSQDAPVFSSFATIASPSINALTAGEFRVDESGAATYSMPLSLPAGIAGVTPQLAFSYNSSGGEGYMGSGWSFAGGSAITRCPKNLSVDTVQGNVSFTSADRLCLDGQRLVRNGAANDKNVTDATYWTSTTQFHTELDNLSLIRQHGTAAQGPKGFTVETKSGEIHYYGDISAVSGNDTMGKPLALDARNVSNVSENGTDAFFDSSAGSNIARLWALKAIKDVKGNYIVFKYHEDQALGEHYLTEVHYTGRAGGAAPFARVVLNYVDNTKIAVGWQAQARVAMTKLLDTVNVELDGAIYRQYRLNYFNTNVLEEKNYLLSIQECADTGSANCLPATNFEWNQPPALNTSYVTRCDNEPGVPQYCWQEPVTENYMPFTTTFQLKGTSVERNFHQLIDINGDGFVDLVYPRLGSWRVRLGGTTSNWTQDCFTPPGEPTQCTEQPAVSNFATEITLSTVGVNKKEYVQTIDYNGDGQRDLLVANGATSNWFILSFVPSTSTVTQCEPFPDNHLCYPVEVTSNYLSIDIGFKATGLENTALVADYDGDGLEDIVFVSGNTIQAYKNLGVAANGSHLGFEHKTNIGYLSGDYAVGAFAGGIYSSDQRYSSSVDINGDGKTELLLKVTVHTGYSCYNLAGVAVRAASQAECEGMGYTWQSTSQTDWRVFSYNGLNYESIQNLGNISNAIRTVDLNGDGYTDIMYQIGTTWYYRLSNGNTFLAPRNSNLTSATNLIGYTYFLDINGDGRTDMLLPTSTSNWRVMLSRPTKTHEQIIFEQRGTRSFDNGANIQFADVNADGKLDLLTSTNDSGWKIYLSNRPYIKDHVIRKITNGFGVATLTEYQAISDKDVYFRQNTPNNVDSDYFSPRAGMYVVSKVSTEVNSAKYVSVNYMYGGLLLHKKGRGLLGFEVLRLRDPHKLLPHIIHTLSDRPVSSTTELSTAKFALALADNIAYLY